MYCKIYCIEETGAFIHLPQWTLIFTFPEFPQSYAKLDATHLQIVISVDPSENKHYLSSFLMTADVKWLMWPIFLSEMEYDMAGCILKNQWFSVDCAQLTEASWITLPLNQFVGLSRVWCVITSSTVQIRGQRERKNFRSLWDLEVILYNP